MAMGLRIARRAASEIERAERWWSENRPAAPDAFRADLKGAFTLLVRQPGVGVKVGNTRLSGRAADAPGPHPVLCLLPSEAYVVGVPTQQARLRRQCSRA